ncbi:fatty acid desaturase [Pseudanabaena sp. FACHB-2040]|uniref:fatty acid desaturase n=1 Tax=Pseudanabaena sp. FACHB-2040 TaxID=2692859 RepID=UPI00168318E2|nr:fatty acid desaturase [Pseudanabaena sp. FACHB-2040]MBD2260942.1 fatty acid desaturase [Pseudanabaena sp. FACHB-2040]
MTAISDKLTAAPDSGAFSDVDLKTVVRSLPKECFQKDARKAWARVVLSVAAAALGYGAIALAPWYLLPLAWFFTGTALTGWFVVAHDCGHRSFANRRWVNDLVGHTLMLPLLYPFHSWRLLHDHHHIHTNEQGSDNAWEPLTLEEYTAAGSLLKWTYERVRGSFWWLGSVGHWALLHFDLRNFAPRDQAKVKVSIAAVAIFAALFFPTLIYFTGIWGVVKFWLMPWLGYHFWMSTFTLVHHTLPDIQFRFAPEWNAVEAQLGGTVHCTYPRWIETLCHDINVHVPHHVSVGIPSYNLRLAHAHLKQNWGNLMHQEERFSWALMQDIANECHIYHPQRAYQSFAEVKNS